MPKGGGVRGWVSPVLKAKSGVSFRGGIGALAGRRGRQAWYMMTILVVDRSRSPNGQGGQGVSLSRCLRRFTLCLNLAYLCALTDARTRLIVHPTPPLKECPSCLQIVVGEARSPKGGE